MINKKKTLNIFLFLIIIFDFVICVANNNQQQFDSCMQESNDICSSKIYKLIITAKQSGLSDDEITDLIVTYSILNKIPQEELEKFSIISELDDLSQKTRSLELAESLNASKSTSAIETAVWIGCSSILISIILILIIMHQNNRFSRKVERTLDDTINWLYSAGEETVSKTKNFFHDTFAN